MGIAHLGGLLLERLALRALPLRRDGAGTSIADGRCGVAPKQARVLPGGQVQRRVRVLRGDGALPLCLP